MVEKLGLWNESTIITLQIGRNTVPFMNISVRPVADETV